MQKVLNGKLIFVLVITAICLWLTFPTFQYFLHVNQMGEDPTPEQIARRNEMLKNGQLVKLGLDLQGGADFLLAIDTEQLQQRKLANEAELIRQALSHPNVDVAATIRVVGETAENRAISVKIANAEDLDIATQEIERLLERTSEFAAVGNVRQSLANGGELILRPTEEAATRDVRDAMEAALKVVRRRVDQFGLTNPIVTRADNARIRVQVPGETEPESVRKALLETAALEFRLLHPNHDALIGEFIEGGMVPGAGTGRIRRDLVEVVVAENGTEELRIKPNVPNVPAGYVLRLGEQDFVDKSTGLKDDSQSIRDLVYLVSAEVPLTGADLRSASPFTNPQDLDNPIQVSIEFKSDGADKFCDITTDNEGKRFAMLLDNVVLSAPTINEPICGGRAQISGGFTQTEARDLAMNLRAGALPAPLRVIEENTIGASLGAESIRNSGNAILLGGAIIIAAMIAIYGTCGAIAVLAMILNVLMILAVLSLMGATLTLSGVGGILLTMGMAVDANILIYERLREELNAGKPLRAAINLAFNRAIIVIFDSNITSILPALVLVLFEIVDGSMKGFWLALGIGLIANVYTAVIVTRALIEAWFNWKKSLSVGKIYLIKKTNFPWMKYRWAGVTVSGIITAIALVYLSLNGLRLGVDFTGGVMSTVRVEQTTNADQNKIVDLLDEDFDDVRVIKVVNSDSWQVTVPQQADKKTGAVPTQVEVREIIAQRMQEGFGDKAAITGTQSIDAVVGREFAFVAFFSIAITGLIIMSYMAVRFQWIFGAAAVAALLHDVFLSLGVFVALGYSVTLDIVSALLIILGYSVNDTIVVFDRVRETMQERHNASVKDILDQAINETLSRTLMTGGSTIIALIVMYLLVGQGLHDFALILLLGVIFGTYSSIYIATALVYVYLEKRGHKSVTPVRKATARVQMPVEKIK